MDDRRDANLAAFRKAIPPDRLVWIEEWTRDWWSARGESGHLSKTDAALRPASREWGPEAMRHSSRGKGSRALDDDDMIYEGRVRCRWRCLEFTRRIGGLWEVGVNLV
jgi:hypothetical protein